MNHHCPSSNSHHNLVAQEKKQKKKRKAEEAAAQKPAGDDWNQGTHAWRPFDRERDLGHAPKPATPAEVGSAWEHHCVAKPHMCSCAHMLIW